LVSGGIGIAPLVFLSQILSRKGYSHEFLAGFKSSLELIPLRRIVPFDIKLQVITEDGSEDSRGMVSDLLAKRLEEHKGSQKGNLFLYSCGPTAMQVKVSKMARHHSIPCQVSLESVMACGVGACQGCVVPSSPEGMRYLRVCKEGPVFWSHQINWELL
jgi:dihydroorotate dehydrogenase electron transfer subunit